jgi:hypothetical protein
LTHVDISRLRKAATKARRFASLCKWLVAIDCAVLLAVISRRWGEDSGLYWLATLSVLLIAVVSGMQFLLFGLIIQASDVLAGVEGSEGD